jgi:hypothetical protein
MFSLGNLSYLRLATRLPPDLLSFVLPLVLAAQGCCAGLGTRTVVAIASWYPRANWARCYDEDRTAIERKASNVGLVVQHRDCSIEMRRQDRAHLVRQLELKLVLRRQSSKTVISHTFRLLSCSLHLRMHSRSPCRSLCRCGRRGNPLCGTCRSPGRVLPCGRASSLCAFRSRRAHYRC